MFRKVLTLVLIIPLVLFSCKSNKKENYGHTETNLKEIELYSARNNKADKKLSDYASKISYIKIDSDLLIESVWSLRTDGEYLALINFCNDATKRSAYLLDMEGKFVREIGKHGKGPGEFLFPVDLALFPESNTIILDDNHGELLKYDYNANFIERTKVHYFSSPVVPLTDTSFVLFKTSDYGEGGSNMINIYNLNNLQPIKTMVDRSEYSGIFTQLGTMCSFSTDNKGIHFWIGYSDTSYYLTRDMELIPEAHFNVGPSRLSTELQYSKPKSRFMEYEYMTSATEINSNTFVGYYDHGEPYYMIYNRVTGTTNSVIQDDILPYGGLPNDIDGGLPFFPEKHLNGSSFYKILKPVSLIKYREELLQNAKENGIDTNNEFFKLLESVNENDNPIIMLVEMK